MTESLQISVHCDKAGAVMYLRGRVGVESSTELRNRLLVMLRRQSPPETILALQGASEPTATRSTPVDSRTTDPVAGRPDHRANNDRKPRSGRKVGIAVSTPV